MKIKLLGLGLAVASLSFFNSCDKEASSEAVERSVVKSNNATDEGDGGTNEEEDNGSVMIINTLNEILNITDDGDLLATLGVKEYTDYLVLDAGDNVIDFVLETGDVLITETLNIDATETLVLVLSYVNGIPVMNEISLDFVNTTLDRVDISELLGLTAPYYADVTNILNVVDLEGNNEQLVLATQLVTSAAENVLTLLEIPENSLVQGILDGSMVQNVDVLGTVLSLQQMAEELQGGGSDIPSLEDLPGMIGLEDFDLATFLTDLLTELGILGGGDESPIETLTNTLSEGGLDMESLDDILLFENENGEIDFLPIDLGEFGQ